jgi:hypothetical protein
MKDCLGEIMLLAEVMVPQNGYRNILSLTNNYKNVVVSAERSRKTGITRVFIKNTPEGWWLALRIISMGAGKLYILKEISIMDIPSKILELGFKEKKWKPEFKDIIDGELRRWRLKE